MMPLLDILLDPVTSNAEPTEELTKEANDVVDAVAAPSNDTVSTMVNDVISTANDSGVSVAMMVCIGIVVITVIFIIIAVLQKRSNNKKN